MTTLDFARKHIRFDKSSPITGPFRDEFYPFLRKPMQSADDIQCKRLVIYKASSCLGTVLGQIINAKRIVCDVGDQKMVCQTDDDAATWSKTRGKDWLMSIPDATRLIKTDKYAITNDLWLFRHKFLEISGPSIAAAQSIQVRYLQTDESHLENYPQGRLLEFEKRMGSRWDRQATHITTAPDSGREIDVYFQSGNQGEWCWRCPNCFELVMPLWEDDSRAQYNGHKVLDRSSLGLMVFSCPYCDHISPDTARARYDLVKNGDYLDLNPTASTETKSYRWSAWGGAHWMAWSEHQTEYEKALDAAKLGDLKWLEDFTKKRKCKAWKAYIPDFGQEKGSKDYQTGDIWAVSEKCRILTGDLQAGKANEGMHLWNLVTEWDSARGNI
jgi:phage terminase large subunit GpA-like protein